MEVGKGEDIFIKDDISRDINTTCLDIETLEPLVHMTISQKHTLLGTKLEFAGVVGT